MGANTPRHGGRAGPGVGHPPNQRSLHARDREAALSANISQMKKAWTERVVQVGLFVGLAVVIGIAIYSVALPRDPADGDTNPVPAFLALAARFKAMRAVVGAIGTRGHAAGGRDAAATAAAAAAQAAAAQAAAAAAAAAAAVAAAVAGRYHAAAVAASFARAPAPVASHPAVDELNRHLFKQNAVVSEGHSGQFAEEQRLYEAVAKNISAPHICEVGFNAGHSAALWLWSNPRATLTAFDIWEHEYAEVSAAFLHSKYGPRLRIIKGDSIVKITAHRLSCDIISVDGGHDYEHALLDLFQFKSLSHKLTVGFIDDTGCATGACEGPNRALRYAVATGLIEVQAQRRGVGGGVTQFRYLFD